MGQGVTVAQKNRRLRQENLREWLSKKCTAQHLVDKIIQIEALDPTDEHFINDLAKYKVANDQRLKIMSKYLPDLKSTELTGPDGEPVTITVVDYANISTK